MKSAPNWPAPSRLAVALGVALSLAGCEEFKAWLAATPPVRGWAEIVDEPDGFRIQTREGVTFYTLNVSDLIDLDGRSPDMYTAEERRDCLAALRAACLKVGALDDSAPVDLGRSIERFRSYRFSTPYRVEVPYARGMEGIFGSAPAPHLRVEVDPEGPGDTSVRLTPRSDGGFQADLATRSPGIVDSVRARSVAAAYFPAEVATGSFDFERILLRGADDFVWRVKGSPAPYFVTADGEAVRAVAGYYLEPGTLWRPRFEATKLETLRARESESLEPRFVPTSAEGHAAVDLLGDVGSGSLGMAWGAFEGEVARRLPDFAHADLADEKSMTADGRAYYALGQELLSFGELTVWKTGGVFASFSGGKFRGIARPVEEAEYEALLAGLVQRAGWELLRAAPRRSPAGDWAVVGAWRRGDSLVVLTVAGSGHGLLIQDWSAGQVSRLVPPTPRP